MPDISSFPATVSTDAEQQTPVQLHRKAHDRFVSPGTQESISDAVYSVPGVTAFDHERIREMLAASINEYLNVPHFKEFRQLIVGLASRLALLTAAIRAIGPELSDPLPCSGSIQDRVLRRLPEYTGEVEDTDALAEWANETIQQESSASASLAGWFTKHHEAVLSGVWRVLNGCQNLGVDDDIAECIAGGVWQWVSDHASECLAMGNNLEKHLWWKGYWAARAWKTDLLNARKQTGESDLIPLDAILEREERVGVELDNVLDLSDVWNPIRIQDLSPKWRQSDLERDLRRAGPFRADDTYEPVELAAA